MRGERVAARRERRPGGRPRKPGWTGRRRVWSGWSWSPLNFGRSTKASGRDDAQPNRSLPSLTNRPAPNPKVRVSRAGPRSSASPLSAAGRLRSASMGRAGSPRVMRAAAAVHVRMRSATSPRAFRGDIQRREIGEALLRGRDAALMGAPERLDRRTFRLSRLLGGVRAPARAGEGQPCGPCKEATPRSANGLSPEPVIAPGQACSTRPPHNRSRTRMASWRSRRDRRCREAFAPCFHRPRSPRAVCRSRDRPRRPDRSGRL